MLTAKQKQILGSLPKLKLTESQVAVFETLIANWPTPERFICLNLSELGEHKLADRLTRAVKNRNKKLCGISWSTFAAICRHFGDNSENSHSHIRLLWLKRETKRNSARLQREAVKNGNL